MKYFLACRFFPLFIAAFFNLIIVGCDEKHDDLVLPAVDQTDVGISLQRVTVDELDCTACDFVVPAGVSVFDGRKAGVKPGDIVCLNAALPYGLLTFENIIGTAAEPVVVTNCGGTVNINTPGSSFVVRFNNSSYLRFTGGESRGVYGIRLSGADGNGLVMGYLTTNFEVDHIEVHKVGFSGIMAKTDPSCDDASIRGNYTMRDVSFHDNYIHDTHGEGFYIGHSSYGGKETACGMRLPHTIENVKVYDNLIRNSGWDGIQLSSAPIGAEVFNNVIENYATARKPAHSFGIIIGGGTGGKCYNNLLKKGSGAGIGVLGRADNTVFNNIIVGAGGSGIFVDERTEPGTGYRIINNTIIDPADFGILLYSELVPANIVMNNIIVNPGSLSSAGVDAYIRKLGANVPLTDTNNLKRKNIQDIGFVKPATFDYRLSPGSPVIDAGIDISSYDISTDFFLVPRLHGPAYDIGAAEYHP